MALVEFFGDFRRQIRIQRVKLYHIDPWKHSKYKPEEPRTRKPTDGWTMGGGSREASRKASGGEASGEASEEASGEASGGEASRAIWGTQTDSVRFVFSRRNPFSRLQGHIFCTRGRTRCVSKRRKNGLKPAKMHIRGVPKRIDIFKKVTGIERDFDETRFEAIQKHFHRKFIR